MNNQLILGMKSAPSLGREDLIVGQSNSNAVKLIDMWHDWPSSIASLHGPNGTGKTHLASIWEASSGAFRFTGRSLHEATAAAQNAKNICLDD